MHIGVPPTLAGAKELETIETFVRGHPIPSEFAHQVMVHATLARFTKIVTDSSEEVISRSLIRLFDTELDSLKTRFPTPWNARVEMAVLTARMHLYSMTIIRIYKDQTTREVLMRSAYATALRIIHLCDQQGGIALHPPEFKHLASHAAERAVPKVYHRALFLATIFLLRFFALNVHAAPDEQEVARNHVAMAQRYLKAGSRSKRDESERAAFLLQVLSRQSPVDVDNTTLRIDDRMAASLVYDAITTGHKLRNLPTDVLHEQAERETQAERTTAREREGEEDEEEEATEATSTAVQPEDGALPLPLPLPLDNDALTQMDAFGNMLPQPLMSSVQGGMADVDINGMDPFGGASWDFALPEDLWGDSVWNMFNSGSADHSMMF